MVILNMEDKVLQQHIFYNKCSKEWKNVIEKFYKQFDPKVLAVDKNSEKVTGIRELGEDPLTQKKVYVRLGKYGPIVQLGESDNDQEKPKYDKLRKGQTIESLDLKFKLGLIQNQLAAKEIYVAKYYIKTKKWIPAINRLKNVVNDYQQTIFIEEALHRLV